MTPTRDGTSALYPTNRGPLTVQGEGPTAVYTLDGAQIPREEGEALVAAQPTISVAYEAGDFGPADIPPSTVSTWSNLPGAPVTITSIVSILAGAASDAWASTEPVPDDSLYTRLTAAGGGLSWAECRITITVPAGRPDLAAEVAEMFPEAVTTWIPKENE